MPMFYSKYLGPTLASRLDEIMSAPAGDQLNLYEELALMRELAGQSVKVYDQAIESEKASAISLAAELTRDALAQVRDMCIAASKIEQQADDKVSARNLSLFINQIVRAIYKACPDMDLARVIEAKIRSDVRLPEELSEKKVSTDRMIELMNATIPSENGHGE